MKFLKFKNEALLAESAVDIISTAAKQSVNLSGAFVMAISGGTSPLPVYERLALHVNSAKFPWAKTVIFWADERYTPHNNSNSNFEGAYDSFLSKAPLDPRHVFRVPTEARSPKQAAALYERLMRKFFASTGRIHDTTGMPVFDMIILGMGEDGHTASLFPNDRALNETHRWVLNTRAPKGTSAVADRITLTLPVINEANHSLFIVPGREKQRLVNIIESGKSSHEVPASLVASKDTLWLAVE